MVVSEVLHCVLHVTLPLGLDLFHKFSSANSHKVELESSEVRQTQADTAVAIFARQMDRCLDCRAAPVS